jgi:hypothetical protein
MLEIKDELNGTLKEPTGASTRRIRNGVPDKARTGVTKACRYNPDLNPTYQERSCTTERVLFRRAAQTGKIARLKMARYAPCSRLRTYQYGPTPLSPFVQPLDAREAIAQKYQNQNQFP